jgi:energy-converting hydrogenase Eha subunit G
MFFLCIGTVIISWATIDMEDESPNIKNIIMIIFGIVVFAFGGFCVVKSGAYYKENESPKTEIVTSISPQIDTIITIKNSISDTTYVYKFNLTEK